MRTLLRLWLLGLLLCLPGIVLANGGVPYPECHGDTIPLIPLCDPDDCSTTLSETCACGVINGGSPVPCHAQEYCCAAEYICDDLLVECQVGDCSTTTTTVTTTTTTEEPTTTTTEEATTTTTEEPTTTTTIATTTTTAAATTTTSTTTTTTTEVVTTTTTSTTTTTTVLSGDWSDNVIRGYGFNDAITKTWGTCAATCDLTLSEGTVGYSTNKQEGTKSLDLTSDDWVQSGSDTYTTDVQFTSSFTMSAWIYKDAAWADDNIVQRFDTVTGYRWKMYSDTSMKCLVGDGVDAQEATLTVPAYTAAEWMYVTCRFDDTPTTGDEISLFLHAGAATDTTTSTAQDDVAGDAARWFLGPIYTDGQVDELMLASGAWTPASICKACSCGLVGAGCTCNGTAYVTEGVRTTMCGSCSLTGVDCNQAAPNLEP